MTWACTVKLWSFFTLNHLAVLFKSDLQFTLTLTSNDKVKFSIRPKETLVSGLRRQDQNILAHKLTLK